VQRGGRVVSRRVEKRRKAKLAVDDMNADCSRDGWLRSWRYDDERVWEGEEGKARQGSGGDELDVEEEGRDEEQRDDVVLC
jgi:hypothetical protein